MVAVLLAVLLPLEQAHCLWMGFETRDAQGATAAGHACCASSARTQPDDATSPQDASAGCVCLQLPTVVLPGLVKATAADAPTAFFSIPALASPDAPALVVTTTDVASDPGRPPLPHDPGAHGLRAPPLFA